MTRTRRIINVVMTIAVFCSLFIVVFAVTNANFSDMKAAYGVNAYEYAKEPDGFYVFRYYGAAPYTDWDIDTSECGFAAELGSTGRVPCGSLVLGRRIHKGMYFDL